MPDQPIPTAPPTIAPPAAAPPAGIAGMPGVRTLRSPGFRLLIATTVAVLGIVVLGAAMLRQASQSGGQFGIDFGDYHLAAQRLAATGTPYAPEMLLGPVDAQGLDRYRYPPPLAQLLVPLDGLSPTSAASIWLVLQALATVLAVWLALGAAGVRRHAERAAWSAAACVAFMPVFDTLWKGNVSGFVALQVSLVAMGGAIAGIGAVTGTLLKVAPMTLLPALLAGGRWAVLTAAIAGLAIVGVSWILSPAAWSAYLVVLPNLLGGSSDYATNLAPPAVLAQLGAPALIVDLARIAVLAIAIGSAVAAPLVAVRRPGRHGWGAAVTLGVAAMLLLPAACWYHYLVALLPVAALAWPAASARGRVALVGAAALITIGVAALSLATLGAVALVVVALHIHLHAPVPGPAAEPGGRTPRVLRAGLPDSRRA